MAINAYLKKQEKSQPLYLKELEEEQTKPKVSRRKRITKIIEKFNETKNWFIEKINKTDKPLARLTKKKEGSNQK